MGRRRRRLTVAFEALETSEIRAFRHSWNQLTVDEILAEPRKVGLGTYLCAACYDEHDHDVPVRRVYDGTKVPEDAACDDCYINIRELQAELRRTMGRAS